MRAVLAFALLATPALLAAQAPVQAHEGGAPVAPAVGLETRVRFTVSDTTIQLNRPRPIGSVAQLEGRLLSYDGEFAVLQLKHGYQYTIPLRSLAVIEQRVGPGACQRNDGRRVLCTLLSVGGGGAIGYVAGSRMGHTADGFGGGPSTSSYASRGALLGGVIGLLTLRTIAQDEWVRVPMPSMPR
jgi:hypothetical protein